MPKFWKANDANVSSWKFFQWDCKTQVCKLRTVKLALCLTHSAFNKEFNRFQRIAYEYKNQTGTRFCFENQTWKPHSFSLTMISLRNPFLTKIMILCPPFSLRAFCHYYLLPVFLQQPQHQALLSSMKCFMLSSIMCMFIFPKEGNSRPRKRMSQSVEASYVSSVLITAIFLLHWSIRLSSSDG